MSDDRAIHISLIREALARLAYDTGEIQRFELAHGGISGSIVYRLWGATSPLILKVTAATTATVVRERGHREVMFYQSLAKHIPVATPQVLASYTDGKGSSAVLLAAYRAPAPAIEWREEQYLEAAVQLASLHSRYWNAIPQLAEHTWLQPFDAYSMVTLADAISAWQPLVGRLDVLGMSGEQLTALLSHATNYIRQIAGHVEAFPATLCHGDCHIGNLLRDGHNRPIWADWQNVGIGQGPRDVSFFVQRAMTDGGQVPENAMFEAYCERLSAEVDTPVQLPVLRQIADAFELQTRLLHWPAYLAMGTDGQILNHLGRIDGILTRGNGRAPL